MLKQGEVIRYPYLWEWQAKRGETEGRKDRPVCVALSVQEGSVTHIFLLAITSTVPSSVQISLRIPETEAIRAGLWDEKIGFIIIDEYNYDIVEKSFYLNAAGPPLGRFSVSFVEQIKRAFSDALKAGQASRIDRPEDV